MTTNEQKEREMAEEIAEEKKEQQTKEAEASCDDEAKKEENQSQEGEEAEKQEECKETEEDESSRYMRLMADFQNYKKRVEKEKSDIYSYANEKLAIELLAVLDNFERALEHNADDASFKEGMEMIFKQLFDVLEKAGLKEIPALGEEFDPNFHNAVMNEETDEYESGKVSGVMQKGYTLNGKVIRPSMVKVAS
ncbi:MAG: nucleotide exchange factor GrpE [Clostridiales Family XIII bacterium]|nr:nucleotide exchange factor GrpE [Clostridia bacterium]MDY3012179.1 nucleotide exchange factor GrpE [Clostridiales Family XIII bacterium]